MPSARDELELGRDGGLETRGADGTSTKPSGKAGAACGAAICFFRSMRRNRNCLAARGWQGCGQGHGLLPEHLGKALAGIPPRLAPVLKLRC